MLQLEQNVSWIDEAIEKALAKKEHEQEIINEIFDTFLIEDLLDYLLEDNVIICVFDRPVSDDVVLSASQNDTMLEKLVTTDFAQGDFYFDLIPKYLCMAISTLPERSKRIRMHRNSHHSGQDYVEYELSIK